MLLKKGALYMEQVINVKIERKDDIKLVFGFEDELSLNLSSDKTSDTQDFFLKLLNVLIETRKEMEFKLDDNKEDLYHDVAQKYLDNLKMEIRKIIKEIPKELD